MKHSYTHLTITLLLVLISFSLAGCLVDSDDPPTLKTRTTDSFRLLTGGEFYDYVVRGQITSGGSSSFFEGTLSINYYADILPEPFGMIGNISVLREETQLTIGGFVYSITRFLQQSGDGSIYVLATRDGSTLYRTKYRASPAYVPEPILILDSNDPMTGGIPLSGIVDIDYEYMPGCESGSSCSLPVQRISNLHVDRPDESPPTTTYQGNADVVTNLGRFEAIRIDYQGLFSTVVSTTLFDIRGACDQEFATFFSSDYIFPEVGVVFMEHSCTTFGGGGHNFTASLYNTNVPVP